MDPERYVTVTKHKAPNNLPANTYTTKLYYATATMVLVLSRTTKRHRSKPSFSRSPNPLCKPPDRRSRWRIVQRRVARRRVRRGFPILRRSDHRHLLRHRIEKLLERHPSRLLVVRFLGRTNRRLGLDIFPLLLLYGEQNPRRAPHRLQLQNVYHLLGRILRLRPDPPGFRVRSSPRSAVGFDPGRAVLLPA